MKLSTRLSGLAIVSAALGAPAHAAGALPVHARYATVDGVRVFYREAGDPAAPHMVLLHGFPSSSHMYRRLIPLLAERFHVIAPDYPGFGQSDMPARDRYAYTFDHVAATMASFLRRVGVERYVLYMQDYGGPVGFRIAVDHPEKVLGLVVQNANAYEDGLSTEMMKVLKPLWGRRDAVTEAPVRSLLTLEGTRGQYTAGARRPDELDPDAWEFDQALLDRPGNQDIQLDLLADYGSNLAQYPAWQRYLREHQPRLLVTWGRRDPFFIEPGAHAYMRDVPSAKLVLLETGHFALEEEAPRIAAEIKAFFAADGS